MTVCHCGKPARDDHAETAMEEHLGRCCDCFDSVVIGESFSDDDGYCQQCAES